MSESRYTTYVLRCADGTLYVGSTNNIEKRIIEHNSSPRGARYTRQRRPVQIMHTEEYATLSESRRREAEIKRLTRQKKLALCGLEQ